MQEAINQAKSELGRDAVILHTRRVRKGGIFGFFAKEYFEIMAALDKSPKPLPLSPVPDVYPGKPYQAHEKSGAVQTENSTILALRQEMSSLHRMMEDVIGALPKTERKPSPFLDVLTKNDIDPEIAQVLIKGLPQESSGEFEPAVIREILKDRISSYLKRADAITVAQNGCKVVSFIGPTGVGKTTTIAKLAANFALKEGYKVALVTADTYRIAALEQLRTYADIIGVPLEVVYAPDELKTAIARHQDKQLVLVDTAGRSPKNQRQMSELQALLAVVPSMDIYLVLNTATKYKEALDVVNKFAICSPTQFLFTKVDEAVNLGTIFNLLYRFPVSFSYITTGQNVPEDIEPVDPYKLANMILRD